MRNSERVPHIIIVFMRGVSDPAVLCELLNVGSQLRYPLLELCIFLRGKSLAFFSSRELSSELEDLLLEVAARLYPLCRLELVSQMLVLDV